MEGDLYKNKYRIKSCRYDGWDYSNDGYYFVTICTKNRVELFGRINNGKMILNKFGEVVGKEWKKSAIIRKEIILDYFIIMPNHLHAIVIINNNSVETNGRFPVGVEMNGRSSLQYYKNNFRMEKKSISSLMAGFKSITAKIINEKRNQPGAKIWQDNYYDRIIRNEDESNRIRQYIIDNPYKWALDRNNPKNL
ncbi:MAG: hypothetical protein PHZ04_01270 [Patescibacteria group bacterium]|nr:hypothetical protein [Patescibacteria group bacterium]MDD5294620.1 hypothetical protein [Patescibacteria group bacterium]MDD5554392.1 hypothetical protein [Patescibacteria group bacterium]